jgi:carboxyl-terminal processing protease
VIRTVSVARAVVPAPGVTATMISARVGRIVVPAFAQGTGRQVRAAVRALRAQHASGLVLDLRGDPGGLLSEAVETASAFLDGGAVVTYARRDEVPQHLQALGRGDTTTPLVVLVDGGTASAAEVVAGALQDRGRAVVVGTRTFGKGTVQEPHRLADGSSLALTVARYTLPSGRSVEGVGIEPDIQVFDSRAALNRSVEVLSGLLADIGADRG